MLDLVLQVWILLTGGLAIYLLSCKAPWMRWAFILGLAGQPAWLASFLIHDQYGMGLLSLFYTYAWGRGVFKYFGKETINGKEGIKCHLKLPWGSRLVLKIWGVGRRKRNLRKV